VRHEPDLVDVDVNGRELDRVAPIGGKDELNIDRHFPAATDRPQDKPPPVREILRVAEHGESWGVPAEGE
jgi:hypothetical protein